MSHASPYLRLYPLITLDSLTVHIRQIPDQRLCLITHLITTALLENALQETFESLDQVLRQPNMEGGLYLPLKWKDGILAKNIIDIEYNKYWELWTRVWFVAGVRHQVKLYALRVGAGAGFEDKMRVLESCNLKYLLTQVAGVLISAVRNYALSHKSPLFSKSYQARALGQSLMLLRFGPSAGEVNDMVISISRNSTLQKDESAPLYPTAKDLAEIDERVDV